jgi:alpha-glucosidase
LKGQRPFVLTRSAFAGIQRYSALWCGDNNSVWEHLQMTLPQLVNLGLSGVPFVGVDIGGFADNASPELFARWVEVGAFLPFCRGHSSIHTNPHEPWAFGEQVEAISRDYLHLRYRLLPYLYTLFWQAHTRGAPILRPLFYHFPTDAATFTLEDQAMFGPSLMLAPVTHPEQTSRQVYLPAGEWYDWWNGNKLRGPAYIIASAPLERLPLYVRAGSVIPLGPQMNFTAERPLNPLTLRIFPGNGEFTLYEDDGLSYDYEQGISCTRTYRLEQTGSTLRLHQSARVGAYIPPERKLILEVIGKPAALPQPEPEGEFTWEWND